MAHPGRSETTEGRVSILAAAPPPNKKQRAIGFQMQGAQISSNLHIPFKHFRRLLVVLRTTRPNRFALGRDIRDNLSAICACPYFTLEELTWKRLGNCSSEL
jgi:hypothetical protein